MKRTFSRKPLLLSISSAHCCPSITLSFYSHCSGDLFYISTWRFIYPKRKELKNQLFTIEYTLKSGSSEKIMLLPQFGYCGHCCYKHWGAGVLPFHCICIFEVNPQQCNCWDCGTLSVLFFYFFFLFYVMTEADNTGCHLTGYFSKEKNSLLKYNWKKVGFPERSLSDLGLISYRSYWKEVLLLYLHNFQGNEICIKEISQETAVNPVDIVSTLQALQMLKFWKGKHLVLKRQDLIDEGIAKEAKRSNSNKTMDPSCLKWTPPKGT
ncbi:unnamed protein product [Nyctereutes procyonoides]|uniref:Histone acetyltransferase n=1 Tax=Nyctereutes procyonoides TaxID=34880 RepID=A0A811ZWC3_NYCPR|nr:unnamed protein product [Nyctereutes procyonoides]